ncbi:MAG: hypothetical protein Cons2KO_20280 [Congregibacter sp.]
MADLILLNKPYQVLSQFTDASGRETLANYVHEPGFYAAGRLDYDSEGLLLLCRDGQLQQLISNPKHKVWKTYLLQLDGVPDTEALERLRSGVELKDGMTAPARVESVQAPALWPRQPPIRVRARHPTSWLRISIAEGRNRQLRRMAAHVGFPVLRLVRERIGDWSLDGLQPGETRKLQIHLPRTGRSTRRRNVRPR